MASFVRGVLIITFVVMIVLPIYLVAEDAISSSLFQSGETNVLVKYVIVVISVFISLLGILIVIVALPMVASIVAVLVAMIELIWKGVSDDRTGIFYPILQSISENREELSWDDCNDGAMAGAPSKKQRQWRS